MSIYGNLWPSLSFDPGYARITDSMAHPPGQNPPSGLIIDPADYPDFPTNYCHAWIRKSDMPDAMRASHTEETDTHINFVYDDEDVNANYPLGFITRGYNSWSEASTDAHVSAVWRGYRGGGGDPWWGGFYDTCFFNELDLGYTDCFFWDVFFQVFWWNDDGSSVNNVAHEAININQGGNQFWYNFLWGGSTITATISNLSADISFTAADLEENGFIDLTSQLPENSGYNHMVGFIGNYFIMGTQEQNQSANGFKPLPTAIYHSQYWQAASDTTIDNYNSLRGSRAGFKARNYYNNNTSRISQGAGLESNGMIFSDDLNVMSNMDPTKFYRGSFMGGLHGSILKSDLDDVNNRIIAYVTDGNVFIVKQTSTTSYFGPYTLFKLIKPSEMRWHLCLFPRFNLDTSYAGSGGYGYDTDKDVYPEYDENDRCTGNLLIGRSEILAKGRPWQLGAIQETTFDPDEMPKPSDEDEEIENTGDDIYRPSTLGVGGTNGFITQYALNAAQVAEIGSLLWLSFTDPNFWQNFWFALTTTGTLNINNLIDYFVSLRVYPFPLLNVQSYSAAGQDMYIGTGATPLHFGSTLHTIDNYADYIDVGYCTIPRYYNDFRDVANTQIMLYLPYCGTVQLNPADVVGGTLHAQYAVDFATGSVTAYVDLATEDGKHYMIAALSGSIGADVPLTASNAAQIAARVAGDALNFAGTVGNAASADVGRSAQAIGSAAIGDIVGAGVGVGNVYSGRLSGIADIAQQGMQAIAADGVKIPMLAGGRGFGSFGAPQSAYVQIRRGIYTEGKEPTAKFKATYGNAYAKPVQVAQCKGYTQFADIDATGLSCEAEELSRIIAQMKSGIYI